MVTKEQQAELARLARAANRRLERATEGQRDALEFYIKKYHVRESKDGLKFQQGKAKTAAEYRQRKKELEKFMGDDESAKKGGNSSTRRGWERIKSESLSASKAKLDAMGYDATEEEIANIAKETKGHNAEFYKALENLTAEKYERYLNEEAEAELQEEYEEEITQRRTDQQATEAFLKARKAKKEAAAKKARMDRMRKDIEESKAYIRNVQQKGYRYTGKSQKPKGSGRKR